MLTKLRPRSRVANRGSVTASCFSRSIQIRTYIPKLGSTCLCYQRPSLHPPKAVPAPLALHSPSLNNIPKPSLQAPRLLDTDPLHPGRNLQLLQVSSRQLGPVVIHPRQPLVLPFQQHPKCQGTHEREDLQPDADPQSRTVVRRVLGPVGKGGPDGGGVAYGVDEGEGGGAFGGGTGDGGGYPCSDGLERGEVGGGGVGRGEGGRWKEGQRRD